MRVRTPHIHQPPRAKGNHSEIIIGAAWFYGRRKCIFARTPRIGPVSELVRHTAVGARNSRIIQAIVLADRLRLSDGIYTGLQTERHCRGRRCDWHWFCLTAFFMLESWIVCGVVDVESTGKPQDMRDSNG